MSKKMSTSMHSSRSAPPSTPKRSSQVTDAGDRLLRILRILQRYHQLQETKNKASGKGKSCSKEHFEFTQDMFSRNNPDGMNHVTHLIMSATFPDEAQLKFRTCWPVAGDRKLESEYRKTCFTWVTEVSKTYPQFFEASKPQFTYFVTPSGDRCVRFLAALAECGLFILAERIEANKGKCVVEKPHVTDEPCVRQEKRRKIKLETAENFKHAGMVLGRIAKLAIYKKQLEAKREEEACSVAKSREDLKLEVSACIKNHPELFPQDAHLLLTSKSRFVVPDGSEFSDSMLSIGSNVEVQDKLALGLRKEWEEKLAHVRTVYEVVSTFLAKYGYLTELLNDIKENGEIRIDAKNYPLTFKPDGNSLPGLDRCFNQILVDYKAMQKKFPDDDVIFMKMPHLVGVLQRFYDAEKKCIQDGEEALASVSVPVKIEDLLFKLKVEKMSLEGTNWNKLIPFAPNSLEVDGLLTLTPSKPRDFVRTTGLTPNFDCGIRLPVQEPKVNRLMESLRISASGSGGDTRVSELKLLESAHPGSAIVKKANFDGSFLESDEKSEQGNQKKQEEDPVPLGELSSVGTGKGIFDDSLFMMTLNSSMSS